MKDNSYIKLACIYTGTVIGAGFASGQEIMKFFGVFGYKGLVSILLASILFSIIGMVVLKRVYENKIKSYDDFIVPIFGKRIGDLIDIIVTCFLFAVYVIMLSGSGAVFYQQFGIDYNIGIYIMALLTFITFLFSIKGVSIVNVLLVPLLIIGIILISGFVIFKEGINISNINGAQISVTGNFISSALIYVSYNSLTVIVVMTSLFKIIGSKSSAIKGGLLGGITLGIIASFIVLVTLIYYTDIYNTELPMLKIASRLGSIGTFTYGIILLLAMFTTAISNGFGFLERIKSYIKINDKILLIIFIILTIPLSKLGFSKLVGTLYPMFGYLGLFIIIGMFLNLGRR